MELPTSAASPPVRSLGARLYRHGPIRMMNSPYPHKSFFFFPHRDSSWTVSSSSFFCVEMIDKTQRGEFKKFKMKKLLTHQSVGVYICRRPSFSQYQTFYHLKKLTIFPTPTHFFFLIIYFLINAHTHTKKFCWVKKERGKEKRWKPASLILYFTFYRPVIGEPHQRRLGLLSSFTAERSRNACPLKKNRQLASFLFFSFSFLSASSSMHFFPHMHIFMDII